MARTVTFNLGPAVGLTSRRLVITPIRRAGDDTEPSAAIDQILASNIDAITVVLPAGQIYRLELTDTTNKGLETTRTLGFNTGDYGIGQSGAGDGGLALLYIDDTSSSSSSSSISTSSRSSISTSSSSISTSSISTSSNSSSPSSQSSTSSSSTSLSSSSRSSQSSTSSTSSSSQTSTSSSSTSSQSSSSQT